MSQIPRPRSVLGDALRYARHPEPELWIFREHGELPRHNHLSERMLRQTVVGRNNGLFARSEGDAKDTDRLMDDSANRVAERTPKNGRLAR